MSSIGGCCSSCLEAGQYERPKKAPCGGSREKMTWGPGTGGLEALERGKPRFFLWGRYAARGASGPQGPMAEAYLTNRKRLDAGADGAWAD